MSGVLPRILPCMRLHVSGDFYSESYIASWAVICLDFPQTRFWSYTRSWIVPDLLKPLETLRRLGNFEILASTDETMPLPPRGWRTAFVDSDPRAKGFHCRSGQESKSCSQCGYCFAPGEGNVILPVR